MRNTQQTTHRISRKGAIGAAAVVTGGALALGLTPAGPVVARTLIGSAQIADNSILSRDIRNNIIQSHDVRNNTLTSADIRDRSVRMHDLAPGVQNRINASGGRGATGAQGPRGLQGAAGADGVSGYRVILHYTRNDGSDLGYAIPAGKTVELVATCPEGYVPLSGGFSNGNTQPGWDLVIHESVPAGYDRNTALATGWSITVTNPTDVPQHAQISLVCARVN